MQAESKTVQNDQRARLCTAEKRKEHYRITGQAQ
jgi:hypothetical protein